MIEELKGIKLREYQEEGAQRIVDNDSHFLVYDTGRGKTITAVVGVQREHVKGDKKTLWIAPLAVMDQTKKVLNLSTLTYKSIQGTESSVYRALRTEPEMFDLLLVNYEAFDHMSVLQLFKIYSIMNIFSHVVVDEAHLMSNPHKSDRSGFLYNLVLNIPKKTFLTATPLISQINQFAHLIALARNSPQHLFTFRREIYEQKYWDGTHPELLSFSRREDDIPQILVEIGSKKDLKHSAPGGTIFKYTRTKNSLRRLKDLIEMKDIVGKTKCIIHSSLTEQHPKIKKFLETEMGKRVAIISGKTNSTKILKQWRNDEFDIAIYSIHSGIEIPADYCIMWDWNVFSKQAIGRGLRTERIGDYEAYYMVSDHPQEQTYWKNTKIKVDKLLKTAIGV